MKKHLRPIYSMILVSLTLVSCGKKEEPYDPSKATIGENKFEQNYVYMWHYDGLKSYENRMAFQTKNYEMFVDCYTAGITNLGINKKGKNADVTITDVNEIKTAFFVKIGDSFVPTTDSGNGGRMIDSGRHLNRWDNVGLKLAGKGNSYAVRREYVATENYIALNQYLFTEEEGSFDFKYQFTLDNYSFSNLENERGVKAVDDSGNGFAFIKQSSEDNVVFTAAGKVLNIELKDITVIKNICCGKGIFIIPIINNSISLIDAFVANETATITAKDRDIGSLMVSYNSLDGVHYVDTTPCYWNPQNTEEARTTYEEIEFNIQNNSETKICPNICFQKTQCTLITGVSPMIVDENGYPTGEHVQISKNWHSFSYDQSSTNYKPLNSIERVGEGSWYHGYIKFNVNSNTLLKKNYKLAYGQWGETYAASNSQLCLIGWGGNQLWNQSALGSWGESITYDPDGTCNKSFIDDVRPFLVKDSTGGNQEFGWSGNVGGADFLKYIEGKEENIINQRATYVTTGPNVTNSYYSGNTSNGKIRTKISSNLSRTNDIVRNIYNIEYTFLDEVNGNSLILFELASDLYMDNKFQSYCLGDETGVVEQNSHTYSSDGKIKDAKNKEFWFGSFNSLVEAEQGNPMFVVRDFNAEINGVSFDKPGYKLLNESKNGYTQVLCGLTLPTGADKTIKRGSIIRTTIEFDIVPNSLSSYYGDVAYLRNLGSKLSTSESLYKQVKDGKLIISASKGTVNSSYPVSINCTNEEICAEFTISGGLGYVPVLLNGLNSYKGYSLEVKSGNSFVKVDQSVKGNDFWQAHFDEETQTYQLGFNVLNGENQTNVYRLVKEGM